MFSPLLLSQLLGTDITKESVQSFPIPLIEAEPSLCKGLIWVLNNNVEG
jgi:hypothetical protein